MLDFLNTFKREYNVGSRLRKSQILLYFLTMGLIVPLGAYIKSISDLDLKILCIVGGLYLLSIAAYILKTFDKAISEHDRSENEIDRLKKEIEQMKKA